VVNQMDDLRASGLPEPPELQHLYHAQRGLLPPEIDLRRLRRVLHLSYADSTWPLALARAHPAVSIVALLAAEEALLNYWQQPPAPESRRVSFAAVDMREPLPFTENFFDCVHLFLLEPLLQPAEWPSLLAECRRVLVSRGAINVVSFAPGPTSSAAYQRLRALAAPAVPSLGVQLPRLLHAAAFRHIGYHLYPVDLGGWNNEVGRACYRRLLRNLLPSPAQDRSDAAAFAALLAEAQRDSEEAAFCAAGMLISVIARK
jgi:ubiquinone/menaquinone biosynthesis C-methylase UbiE